MKRIIVCIVLTAVIFLAGTVCLFYTANITDRIMTDLDDVSRLFLSGDSEGAAAAASRASREWESFKKLHILTMDNDHILEITMSITKIESLSERADEETVTECALAKELIETYKNKNIPSIMNILQIYRFTADRK